MNRDAALYQNLKKVLIDKETLAREIARMGQRITRDYRGCSPVMVCVLKGAAPFYMDLLREIDLPLEMDFMTVSSYQGGTCSTGTVRVKKDLDTDIAGRDVMVVEDIVDTGLTMKSVMELLKCRGARSVKTITLLDKPSRRKVDFSPDYIVFSIENEFVVGYGLDYAERYRNLPEVGVLDPDKETK